MEICLMYDNFLSGFGRLIAAAYARVLCALRSSLSSSEDNAGENSVMNSGEDRNAAVSRLMDSYGNSILRLAYSYLHSMADAEEILQDTLIKYIQ